MINPRASIIMSTYNDGQYIKQSIESVLTQSFTNFEFIIINDCSTDNTAQIIADIKDERIQYVCNERNKGLVVNLNEGIARATGEYIARIDSDDMWANREKLQKQISFLESHEDYGLIGTQAHVYDTSGMKLFSIKNPCSDRDIRRSILTKNTFVHSSVVFRKALAITCGGYNPEETYVEDYGLWMRMGKCTKLTNLESLGVYYRENKKGITQQHNLKQVRANIRLIQTHRTSYPGYVHGTMKWRIKEFLLFLGLQGILNQTKRIFS